MYIRWILALCTAVTCSNAATVSSSRSPRNNKPGEADGSDLLTTGRAIQDKPTNCLCAENDQSSICVCVPFYLCNANKTIIEDGGGLLDPRLNIPRECPAYMHTCCKTSQVRPRDDPITPPPPKTPSQPNVCGQRNFNGVSSVRILGSKNEAQFGEFPWVVAIIKKVNETQLNQCSGSLIQPGVVLTIAHCVQGKTDTLSVVAGEWDVDHTDEPLELQSLPVKKVVIHEHFNNITLRNDIALLFLDKGFKLALNVAPICLPNQGDVFDSVKCVANGWGKNAFGETGRYQRILKKVEMPLVPNSKCQESLRNTRLGVYFNLHSSFLCAGGDPGIDTCQGDGGAPLVCPVQNKPGTYVQVGSVSWGIGCGNQNPGVYTNIAQFRNWIDNKVEENTYSFDPRLKEPL